MNFIIKKRYICIFLFLFVFLVLFLFKKSKKDINEKKLKIGILQLAEHEALDNAREGFIQKTKELKLDVEIIYKNAQGEQNNCVLIGNQFIENRIDLILAIGTLAAQSVSSLTKTVPILITAVTNPEDAGLVKSNKYPQTNVTGTSDLTFIEKQINLIKEIKPLSKKIAILSTKESNSEYQSKIAFEEAKKINLEPKIYTFSEVSEIESIILSFLEKVDAVYTPTDNKVASNFELIVKTLNNRIPLICGEENLIKRGGTATYGINYFDLGVITADQALEILYNKKLPYDMPIRYCENPKLSLNLEKIRIMNLDIPKSQ